MRKKIAVRRCGAEAGYRVVSVEKMMEIGKLEIFSTIAGAMQENNEENGTHLNELSLFYFYFRKSYSIFRKNQSVFGKLLKPILQPRNPRPTSFPFCKIPPNSSFDFFHEEYIIF